MSPPFFVSGGSSAGFTVQTPWSSCFPGDYPDVTYRPPAGDSPAPNTSYPGIPVVDSMGNTVDTITGVVTVDSVTAHAATYTYSYKADDAGVCLLEYVTVHTSSTWTGHIDPQMITIADDWWGWSYIAQGQLLDVTVSVFQHSDIRTSISISPELNGIIQATVYIPVK